MTYSLVPCHTMTYQSTEPETAQRDLQPIFVHKAQPINSIVFCVAPKHPTAVGESLSDLRTTCLLQIEATAVCSEADPPPSTPPAVPLTLRIKNQHAR